jgi:hypothetical protein
LRCSRSFGLAEANEREDRQQDGGDVEADDKRRDPRMFGLERTERKWPGHHP